MGKYTFNVAMSCPGCSNAVRNALKNKEETNVEIDLEKKEVIVESDKSCAEILEIINKTGKTVSVKAEEKQE